jgi:hypothetical protein
LLAPLPEVFSHRAKGSFGLGDNAELGRELIAEMPDRDPIFTVMLEDGLNVTE